jgi:hypothetical protein
MKPFATLRLGAFALIPFLAAVFAQPYIVILSAFLTPSF